MLRCLAFVLLLLPLVSHAQYGVKPKELDFAGTKIKVPNGCTSVLNRVIECETYTLRWVYFSPEDSLNLEAFANGVMTSEGTFKSTRKREPCYLLGKPANCLRDRFKYAANKLAAHQIKAYGVINKRPAVVYVTLYSDKELVTNNDLPELVRTIFQFQE